MARSVSGHAMVETQQHYSSVNGTKVRDGLAKVISLAGFRQAQNHQPKQLVVIEVIERKEA